MGFMLMPVDGKCQQVNRVLPYFFYRLRHEHNPLVHLRQVDVWVILFRVPRNPGVDRLGPNAVFVCLLMQPSFHRDSHSVCLDVEKLSLSNEPLHHRIDTTRMKVY